MWWYSNTVHEEWFVQMQEGDRKCQEEKCGSLQTQRGRKKEGTAHE